MDAAPARNKPCPCPACDDSGRVPTSAGELGRGCYQAALAAIERRRANGGEWPDQDLEYDARVRNPAERAGLLRRLTLKVCESAQMLMVADSLAASAPPSRGPRGRYHK